MKTLQWEWPADRTTVHRLLIRVESYESFRAGLFGIGRSPSLGRALPDPMTLRGTVVGGGPLKQGEAVDVTLPKADVMVGGDGVVRKGDLLGLGLVSDVIVSCARRVPTAVAQSEGRRTAWLESLTCGDPK